MKSVWWGFWVKDEWEIKDGDGNAVTFDTFFTSLNTYIESKVGDIVEKNYFAEYLEPLWVEIKNAFHTDINGMSHGLYDKQKVGYEDFADLINLLSGS